MKSNRKAGRRERRAFMAHLGRELDVHPDQLRAVDPHPEELNVFNDNEHAPV